MTPRWNSGAVPYFHSSPEDRRDSSQSPAPVEVAEVCRLDSATVRVSGDRGNGKGGGERAGRAHSESLTDRKLVFECDTQMPGSMSQEPTSDVLRDGKRSGDPRKNLKGRPRGGAPFGRGEHTRLEHEPGPDRATAPRVPGSELRRKYSGYVTGGKGPGRARSFREGHFSRSLRRNFKPVTADHSRSLSGHPSARAMLQRNAKRYNPRTARRNWSLIGDV